MKIKEQIILLQKEGFVDVKYDKKRSVFYGKKGKEKYTFCRNGKTISIMFEPIVWYIK